MYIICTADKRSGKFILLICMGLGWKESGLWTRPKMRGKEKEWPISPGQRQGTRYAQIRTKCKMQHTICNRKPPILFLHLKLARMSLHVMMVLVHVILFFSRLHFGVKFGVLWRRVWHDYKWFRLWILGLGVNVCFACSVVRPRQITMLGDRLRFR